MIISKIINRIVRLPKLIYHRIIRRWGIALSFYQIGFIILANGWKPEWKPVFYWTDSSGYHLSTESAYVAHKNVS